MSTLLCGAVLSEIRISSLRQASGGVRRVRLALLTFAFLPDSISAAMPRKPRIELSGALYHIISRGNNRRKIFRTGPDYLRFTEILHHQKSKLPFYLYAYCLMPNHFHLLIEMQDHPISRIMQRILTAYSQFHNRKYKKIGHPLSGALQLHSLPVGSLSGRACQVHPSKSRSSQDRQPPRAISIQRTSSLCRAGSEGIGGQPAGTPTLRRHKETRRRGLSAIC